MAAQNPTKAKFVKTQGTALSVSKTTTLDPKDEALTWADLSVTIKQPQFQGGQSDEIETTVLASVAKEFTTGLADNGTFSMSGNWKADDEAQTVLRTARDDAEPRAFKSVFKDGTSSTFLGLVTQFTWDAAPNGTVNGTFNVRITGAVSFDLPGGSVMARAKAAEGGIRGFALDPLRNFKREEVVVPEWDGAKVIVRALSAGDWVEYRKRATELILVARQSAGLSETPTEGEEVAKEESVEVSSAPLYAFVLTRTLFDDSGARVFDDGDVEEVAEAFSPVHDLLVSKAFELSGIAADADAPDPVEAAGND